MIPHVETVVLVVLFHRKCFTQPKRFQLRTELKLFKIQIKNAQNRNRTSDTRIFSPLLYQLSYLGRNTEFSEVRVLLYMELSEFVNLF